MEEKITFTRQELYNEIWAVSVKKVAEKYDLNYSKLLKKVKEYAIPIPNSKYWMDLRFGKDVTSLVIPLDSPQDEIIAIEKNSKKQPSKQSKVNLPIKSNLQVKKVQVEEIPKAKLIDEEYIRSRLYFLEKEKINTIIHVLKTLDLKENKRLHKKVSQFKKQVNLWHTKEKNAKRPYWDDRHEYNRMERPLYIKDVDKENYLRLYKLLDLLVETFEKIGEKIQEDLSICIGKDIVTFEIIESQNKEPHELTKKEAQELLEYQEKIKNDRLAFKPKIRKYDYFYNGKFRIKLSNGKYIKDKNDKVLEEMLMEIVVIFYECYLKERTDREEREEWNRQYEEKKRIEEEFELRVKNEKEKVSALLNTIDDYLLAQQIRTYARFLESKNLVNQSEEIDWMLKKADWIDPTISLEDELLGKREHEKDKEEKENFLKRVRRSSWGGLY